MADLDDFFAKRDRKKGKTPAKKFSTPDEMAKKIEDTKQKSDVKVRKDRLPGQGQDEEDNGTMPGDEDEWREFEVAKKDYTGLKIQPLMMTGDMGGSQGGMGNNDGSSGGGGAPQTAAEQRARGPWNKGEADQEEQHTQSNSKSQAKDKEREREAETTDQPAPPPPSSGASSGAYVTPRMRNRRPGSPGPSPIEPLRNNRAAFQKMHAPDIHSEEYFPTLGGDNTGKKSSGNTGSGPWTEAGGAGGGGRVAIGAQRSDTNAALQLGNRFTSLTHDS